MYIRQTYHSLIRHDFHFVFRMACLNNIVVRYTGGVTGRKTL